MNKVGGQAVLEGVMMKGGENVALAVRSEDGTIKLDTKKHVSVRKKYKICRVPVIRGAVNMVETFMLSYSTLEKSAEMLGIDTSEPETKFEKWLTEKLGDSIMKGVTFNGSGYHLCPDHDLPQLAARGIEIENHTKMGATIGDGLRAMDKYLTGCDSQTTVLLGYGGNDCDYDWQAISDAPSADHSPKTAPDAYIEGMRRAIRKAQDAGAMVAVASLVPLDADRYLQFISKNRDGKNILSWLGDAAHLYRWQEYYNALTVQMARAFGCRLVDLRTAFLQSRNFLDLLCPDGIHPTDSGYALAHKTLSAAMY